jgi:hypothetical protein
MKTLLSRAAAAVFPVLLLLLASSPVKAAPLVAGSYHFQVPVSPVLLNGRYPVFVNENKADRTPMEGRLDVATSPTGKITGKVEIFAEFADVTGSIKIRKSGTTLKLRGKTASGKRVTVKATLTGTTFNGTVKLGNAKAPARIDLAGVASATLDYTLALTVDAKGKITGTGTAKTDVADIAVTVNGKTDDDSAKLTIKGGKTMFEGNGPTSATGFTAKWKAQSFGALIKGEGLAVTKQ